MKKITSAEIDRRLKKLRESRMSAESYTMTGFDGRTVEHFHDGYSIIRTCSICGKSFEIKIEAGLENTVEIVEEIVEQYKEIGMEAKFICNCLDCAKVGANHYEVHIKAVDENEWHISVPYIDKAPCKDAHNTDIYVTDFEYGLVLKFLSAFTDNFSKLTYKGIISEKYVPNCGFIKTQIDLALSEVLGLTITYDMDEMRRNIDFIFKYNDMSPYIETAYELLEQRCQQQFTVWEYRSFMDKVYDIISRIQAHWKSFEYQRFMNEVNDIL